VWINDFDNAYNEPYVRMYFAHAGYNDYPVVGVSWDQANAFCQWRTQYYMAALGNNPVIVEPYRLPTEAEWEFAARMGDSKNMYPWEGNDSADDRGCFYANFKPGDGDYVRDGHLITARVGTYTPNDFGLYDMAGNVSEWTSTSYNEALSHITSDMNPEYKYNAAKEDPYRMKRKIVRGGSWKDVSHYVRADLRMWEYQNEQRSYIGFRCVRTQVGFAKGRGK
jgi:gliding motility-associated lipoprotein GldK